MKTAVVVFPGSNCDRDIYHVCRHVMRWSTEFVWHKETTLPAGTDLVILPGGFSYGDYLRSGAIARFSAIMSAVKSHADRGGAVIGVCNGFQILTESGLLPGALCRNRDLKFICAPVGLRVENAGSIVTRAYRAGERIRMPIAHADGCYQAGEETLKRLEGEGRVLFRYVDEAGEPSERGNPNGSLHNIAGVLNDRGNVAGLMPHPERCAETILGSTDGRRFFESLVK
ncbi:MAG: Phosphoribosylformylglycinamidine synthase subunit PurQ [Myxococcota bacterium]|nr:Phosphoribosylformylglycinamidine synthase subunit PurQ [Myxococcota bacterium]